MLMKVPRHPSAGDAAEVDPDVETLGGDGPLEQLYCAGRLLNEVGGFFDGKFFEVGLVLAGGDEQVDRWRRDSG